MKPNYGALIKLTDTAGTRIRLSGVILTVMLFAHGKQRFGFRTSPSDAEGIVVVSYSDLEQARRRNLSVQPLDYKTTLDECDDTLKVTLPSQGELTKAADTLETMGLGRWNAVSTTWRNAANGHLRSRELIVAARDPMPEYDLICELAAGYK